MHSGSKLFVSSKRMCSLKALFAAYALVLGLQVAQSCSTPPAGCTKDKCSGLSTLATPTLSSSGYVDKRIGWYYGLFNKNINGGNSIGYTSVRGGPYVNYEVFPIIETSYIVPGVDSSSVTTLAGCCALCAATDSCWVYQFYANKDWRQIKTISGAYATNATRNWQGRQCILLTGGSDKAETSRGTPFSGTHTQQISTSIANYPNYFFAPAWVGGLCNGNASVTDDPHFTGALGTRFEFNGDVDKSFCLISDEKVHVNIRLGGYLDPRTTGATVLRNGMAIRTWIKEIGLLWKDGQGAVHTAVLVARRGQEQERGAGFLSRLIVDGERAAVPEVGREVQHGLFSLELTSVTKRGPFDVENYLLAIGGVLQARVRMRVAHPLLQSQGEAFAHFNILIDDLEATPKVHGILGQTFRQSLTQRMKSLEYQLLSRLLGGPIVADGNSGAGFLDGSPSDYVTSDLLATDNKFAAFAKET